jgi:hypothetical protein
MPMIRNALIHLLLILGLTHAISIDAQSIDPVAELEAWNRVKESHIAADYHAFLKKFPNSALAIKASERMNILGDPEWNELKKSNDPLSYRDYIKAHPDSPFVDQAQARLKVLTTEAIRWETAKATDSVYEVIDLIEFSFAPSFTADAKLFLEPRLWDEISRNPTEYKLKTYAEFYSQSDRGNEAATRYEELAKANRRLSFEQLKATLESKNGLTVVRHNITLKNQQLEILDTCAVRNKFAYVQESPTRDSGEFSWDTFDLKKYKRAVLANFQDGSQLMAELHEQHRERREKVIPLVHNYQTLITIDDRKVAQTMWSRLSELIERCHNSRLSSNQ